MVDDAHEYVRSFSVNLVSEIPVVLTRIRSISYGMRIVSGYHPATHLHLPDAMA